jgi:hypothetical protein
MARTTKTPTARKPGQRRTAAEKVADGLKANRAPCACGCGATPAGKRSVYLPGHDRKHHVSLKAAGRKVTYRQSADVRAKNAARIRERRAAERALGEQEAAARAAAAAKEA